MARECGTSGEIRNAYGTFVGKPEEKSHMGRPRCGWIDNIKLKLKRDRMVWYALN
jgi:hypothetical protein